MSKYMRKLLIALEASALSMVLFSGVFAQTEIDVWGQMGKGTIEGQKVSMSAGGSFLAHAGTLLVGLNLSNRVDSSDWAYGLTTGLDLGTWSLSFLQGIWSGFALAEIGMEVYGETDVSDDSFKFSKGSFGIGFLPDFKPDNRLRTAVKILYHGEAGQPPEARVQIGARIEVGG